MGKTVRNEPLGCEKMAEASNSHPRNGMFFVSLECWKLFVEIQAETKEISH